jgi:hypothetical protein
VELPRRAFAAFEAFTALTRECPKCLKLSAANNLRVARQMLARQMLSSLNPRLNF